MGTRPPLEAKGFGHERVSLDDDPHFGRKLHELTGGWTVLQIVVDGR